ncbi:MAG: 23S rRNA (uracil(1939)-C(5))-methyltransferase RlmD [Lachnospiraceae bacterium]|nr:23S rRNA (uracil(1939)-C(5))-methyltransferase RlmD [Lachnospiraceae bacterium]
MQHPDPSRENACPHADVCGGCAYQDIPYEESKALKESQVKRLLAPSFAYQDAPVIWDDIRTGPSPYAYRNKMEFTFGDAKKDGPLELGLHRKGRFHDIVSVTECRIVDADFRQVLTAVCSFFRPFYERHEISYYHRKRNTGYLRHLLVRKAAHTGEMLVCLVTSPAYDAAAVTPEQMLLAAFRDMLLALDLPDGGTIRGILHTKNDAVSDVIRDDGTDVLYGTPYFEETLLGLKFTITPFSFFQTNSAAAEVLYETVRGYIREALGEEKREKTGTVFDLYCGTGTIAQLMSHAAGHVVGVELNEEAVFAARQNAVKNNIMNCSFVCGDVLKVIGTLVEKPDLIILDPPRAGVHPRALPPLCAFGADHIVYISCKPESLARDMPFFLTHGYEARRACCIEQFPFTKHIETVCLLSNTHSKKKESYITLDVEMADYYRIKNEGKNSTT